MESSYNPVKTMSLIDNILADVFKLKAEIIQAKKNKSENTYPLTLSQQIRMGTHNQPSILVQESLEQTYLKYICALNKKITTQKKEKTKMKEKMERWLDILKSEGYDECNNCGAAIPNVGGGHLCRSTTNCFFTR